jgi:1-acyl-sn-glycerol-3-phosphate acyltransferase
MTPALKIAYQPYKWLFIVPFIFVVTMILSLVCILSGMLLKQDAADIIAVIWAKLCCSVVPLKVCITGKKNYHKNRSYIVVANHQSMADIPVIHGYIGLKIKWIMKKELEKIPVFGTACRYLGCIYVDRSDHEAAMRSMELAKKKLGKNSCVLFFAEGTRSRNGKIMPFKKGAFRFALETGLPILPVTIKNSFKILAPGSLDLIPGNVEIIVHRPFHIPDQCSDKLDAIIEHTRKTIADAM